MPAPSRPLPYDFKGHVAIVSGANHGIGAATAITLAEHGASVLVTYLRPCDPDDFPVPYRANRAKDASEVLSAIRARDGRAIAIEADLGDAAIPARLFDTAEAEFGPVDILVNNASGQVPDTFGSSHYDAAADLKSVPVSAATHDRVFSVDARGGALMIAEVARRHIARQANWGRIVGLTSGGALGFPGEVSYGAAKAALENYTMAAGFELASFGVTANVVYPPVTDTGWVTDVVRESVEHRYDLIHIVTAQDVAEIIAFLCSDYARLITANLVHLR